MPKYLTNEKFYDDGAGFHAENGIVDCLDLFINTISVEDLIQASIDLVEVEITALQTDIAALQTTLTTCSYDSGTQTFIVGNNLKCLGTFTLYIGGTSYNVNTFITNTNNSIQTNTNNITTNTNNIITNTADIQTIKTTLTGVSYNGSSGAFQIGGTTDCRILNTLYLYDGSVPYSMNVFVSNTNTNIVALVNKTQDISYSAGLTTIEKLSFNTFINGTSKANFENIMTMCYDLSSNCQGQINGAYASAAAAAAAAAAAYTGANLFTTDAIATVVAAQALVDAGQDTAIDTLDGKLASYTYNLADNIVSINSRVNCNSFGDLNFTGDLNQTYQANKNNTLRNPTYFLHNIELQNNKGFLIDAGSTFENNGITTINGNLTCTGATSNLNSTTTQIGTSSASTLNIYANPKIYNVNTQIRNNSTTASGTLAPYLKLENIATNSNAFKLLGISIGKEQILNNESNCNIGYNYVSDGSTSNFGYLGLNINTLNTLECLRWSSTKVSITNGNFEVANNASVLGSLTTNTINNTGAVGAPMAITTTGTNSNLVLTSSANLNLFANSGIVKLNSNNIEVGCNQSAGVGNTISIGTTNSLSVTNIPNGLKTNTIAGYNTSNPVAIDNPSINIGYNQPVGSANSINIGNTTSASVVSLNGIILVNGYMSNLTNLTMSGIIGQF